MNSVYDYHIFAGLKFMLCGIVCECREVGKTIAQSIKRLPLGHKDLSPHIKAGHGVGICNASAGRVDPLSSRLSQQIRWAVIEEDT